ncbi:hypothetical protein [Blastococcus sp. SYSU DS0617]
MLIVLAGLLLMLAARPFSRWAAETHDAEADPDTVASAAPAWLWGYRTAGAIVVLIGIAAHCFPITAGP